MCHYRSITLSWEDSTLLCNIDHKESEEGAMKTKKDRKALLQSLKECDTPVDAKVEALVSELTVSYTHLDVYKRQGPQ